MSCVSRPAGALSECWLYNRERRTLGPRGRVFADVAMCENDDVEEMTGSLDNPEKMRLRRQRGKGTGFYLGLTIGFAG